jgi:hypothetical protein
MVMENYTLFLVISNYILIAPEVNPRIKLRLVKANISSSGMPEMT